MKAKNFSSKFLTSKMQIVSNKINPEGIVVNENQKILLLYKIKWRLKNCIRIVQSRLKIDDGQLGRRNFFSSRAV